MNGELTIKVDQLSKQYHIKSAIKKTNRYGFFDTLKLPYRMLQEVLNPYADKMYRTIWALKDVSFEVRRGERVGIIGRNGAGKSTLLKILSRLIYPTTGEARIYGRVNSLLEVGTGFNPNLTGRENIYLNATLHGLKRIEINERFDDIVEFSGISKFIETPIKYYSSGMYMRLAFSVAAHLNADILLLDEVLAVGDMAFQQKCLKRVEGLTSIGSTVLLVSHSLGNINRFCDRCIWIEDGCIIQDGTAVEVTQAYTEKILGIQSNCSYNAAEASLETKDEDQTETAKDEKEVEFNEPKASLVSGSIVNFEMQPSSVILINQRTGIEFVFDVYDEKNIMVPAIAILDENDNVIFWAVETDKKHLKVIRMKGRHTSIAWIPENFLNEGNYYINLALVSPETSPMTRHFYVEKALSFYASEADSSLESARGIMPRSFPGSIRPKLKWTLS